MGILTSDEYNNANSELSQQTKKAFEQVINHLNKMTCEKDVEAILEDVLGSTHRTLQQNYFRHVIVPSIRFFAKQKEDGYFDLRNEASCKISKNIVDNVELNGIPFV